MTKHRFDAVSLIAGILFAGIGVTALAGNLELSAGELRWLWPVAILALGLALLVGTGPDRGSDRDREAPASDEER